MSSDRCARIPPLEKADFAKSAEFLPPDRNPAFISDAVGLSVSENSFAGMFCTERLSYTCSLTLTATMSKDKWSDGFLRTTGLHELGPGTNILMHLLFTPTNQIPSIPLPTTMIANPLLITNVQLVTPDETVRPVCIEIDSETGIISAIHEGSSPPNAVGDVIFDGGGELFAFAGFIDIHTHGANGVDLSMAKDDTVSIIAEAKLKEGVTSFLPTTWTASPEHKIAMAHSAAKYYADQKFARTPFMHIEGPYLNPDQAGAQDARYMRPPDASEIQALHEICPVGLVSLAVELDGAPEFIREMKTRLGIATSAAHSAATYAEYRAAREAGLGHLTHFCNQMSRLHHREIGLVGAGFLDDDVMIEIICDTIHLCPEMIELTFKHRSCDRMMLITDSIAASHLGDGRYPLHDTEIIVKDGAARIPAGNLAGSIVQFYQALQNVADITRIEWNELSKTTAANQARALGLNDRGRIQQGMLADLTLLGPSLNPVATFVGGEKRWEAGG